MCQGASFPVPLYLHFKFLLPWKNPFESITWAVTFARKLHVQRGGLWSGLTLSSPPLRLRAPGPLPSSVLHPQPPLLPAARLACMLPVPLIYFKHKKKMSLHHYGYKFIFKYWFQREMSTLSCHFFPAGFSALVSDDIVWVPAAGSLRRRIAKGKPRVNNVSPLASVARLEMFTLSAGETPAPWTWVWARWSPRGCLESDAV